MVLRQKRRRRLLRGLQGNLRSRLIARIAETLTEYKGDLESIAIDNKKTRTRVGEETLCWTCSHAYPSRGCSWARRRIPVEGWVADEHNYVTVKKTYDVRYCPEYENDSCSLLNGGAECDKNCYKCSHWKDSYGHKMRFRYEEP